MKKSGLSRRQLLALGSAAGAAGVLGIDPVRQMLSTMLQGLIAKARRQDSAGGPAPRNYVQINLYGSPSRWLFDHPLKPFDGEPFVANSGISSIAFVVAAICAIYLALRSRLLLPKPLPLFVGTRAAIPATSEIMRTWSDITLIPCAPAAAEPDSFASETNLSVNEERIALRSVHSSRSEESIGWLCQYQQTDL